MGMKADHSSSPCDLFRLLASRVPVDWLTDGPDRPVPEVEATFDLVRVAIDVSSRDNRAHIACIASNGFTPARRRIHRR